MTWARTGIGAIFTRFPKRLDRKLPLSKTVINDDKSY